MRRPGKRETYVRAYARPEALRVGFEWYRAFPQDEKDNSSGVSHAVETPVLYLRGECEGDLQPYVEGLRKSGLENVAGKVIRGSGHFAPDEQPCEVRDFLI